MQNGARKSFRLEHDAFLYASDEEFVTALAPFLREGLARGEPAVAITTPDNLALLRDGLGADAGPGAVCRRRRLVRAASRRHRRLLRRGPRTDRERRPRCAGRRRAAVRRDRAGAGALDPLRGDRQPRPWDASDVGRLLVRHPHPARTGDPGCLPHPRHGAAGQRQTAKPPRCRAWSAAAPDP